MYKNSFLLFLFVTSLLFADTTDFPTKKNMFYYNIPGSIGYERQLPLNFAIGINLSILGSVINDTNGWSFSQTNKTNYYLNYNIYLGNFIIVPEIGLYVGSEDDSINPIRSPFLATLFAYNIKINNSISIIPFLECFRFYFGGNGIHANILTLPSVRFCILF